MKIDLTADAAEWVQTEVASGRFATAEDAICHVIDAEKLRRLRGELAAAEAEGGAFSADDVSRFVCDHLDGVIGPAAHSR